MTKNKIIKNRTRNSNLDMISLIAFDIEDAWKFIKFYESNNKDSKQLLKLLEKEDLLALKKISNTCKKDVFNKEVIEAYWIGNKLFDVFWEKNMKQIPYHNLQAILNKKNLNCLITVGEIISVITNSHAVAKVKTISESKGEYVLLEEERAIIYDNKLISLKIGDSVLLHWGMARIKLSPYQKKNALKSLKKLIDLINSKKFK